MIMLGKKWRPDEISIKDLVDNKNIQDNKLQIYNLKGVTEGRREIRMAETIDALCNHKPGYTFDACLLPVEDLLAVSCAECHSVRFLDIHTKVVTKTFYNPQCYPGVMCLGAKEQIFVADNRRYPDRILELWFNGNEISLEVEYAFRIDDSCGVERSICYIPGPRSLIAVNYGFAIYTVPLEECNPGQVWYYMHEGSRRELSDAVYSSQVKGLLVSTVTQNVNEVLVVNPGDGTLRQIITRQTDLPGPCSCLFCCLDKRGCRLYMYKGMMVTLHSAQQHTNVVANCGKVIVSFASID